MNVEDDFPKGPMRYGRVKVFAAFRCGCGKLAAMADQPNGRAAMLHETPHCEPFEAVRSMPQGEAYFLSLQQIPLTEAVASQLQRNQGHA